MKTLILRIFNYVGKSGCYILHDGRTNKYSFMHFGQKISLAPLSPSEVREDQKKIKEKYELEKRQKETEKSKEKKESLLEKKGEF